jgi:hypothetical protein
MNGRLAKTMVEERRKQLRDQMLAELVEMLTAKTQLRDGSEAQNQGRRSGDKQWKKARGEIGGATEEKKDETN